MGVEAVGEPGEVDRVCSAELSLFTNDLVPFCVGCCTTRR